MLLFFTGFAFFCWSKFHTYQVTAPFSMLWWKWLFTLGVALGLVSSVKWVGFFIVAVVGLYTLESLWDMLGNPLVSKTAYMYHWLSRIVGLIVTPLLIYLASFAIHFAVLNHSGPGDAQMSSLFQSNLIGTDLRNSPLEIMYGSEVTLKNTGYGGGLLHSHVQTYPHGSHQQQVTCYHHKDANNKWMIVKPRTESGNVQPLLHLKQPVLHGDTVRLLHVSTGRNLHSHALAGPVTKSMHEVSGYGNDTVGDANDHWLVEVVKDFHRAPPYTTLHTMATQFRLRHAVSGCLLRSHQVSLPKWGFNQAEVVCDQRKTSKKETDQNNVWNVEQHWNPEFPPAPFTHFQSRFLQNVMDLNVAMMASNNALTPDPDKEPDGLTSTPSQWPFLTTGLRMCSWGDTDIKFYMLGNPLVWWFSSVSLGVYVITWCGYQVRAKCHYAYPTMYPRFVYLGKYLLGAWFLHYFPFFLMGRVLYLHHYFPALYFSMFMGPFLVDTFLPPSMQMTRTRFYLRHACFLLMNLSIGVVFYMFSPLSLGLNTSSKEFARDKKWMENWNLD
ncbi:Protein O-mannosyltransferase 2 [Coelomomyces lativittatus]|nr:Protein O-mannosyltransferase 2 [Coelomomyces lativittatus]